MSTTAAPSRPQAPARSATKTAGLLVAAAVGVLLLLLLLGVFVTRVLVHSGLGAADARVDANLVKERTSTLNRISHYTTFLAETMTISALAALLFVALRLTLRRWRESIFLGVSVAGEVLIFLAVTLLIHRHRPAVPELDSAPPTSSFPSGHTAASVALYGGLAVLAWRSGQSRLLRTIAVVLAIAIPLGVASSRVYRGMHYPSDVLGGMVLSICWLTATATLLLPRRTKPDRR
ncbi:MAG: phosphatase PAP2 family protein [Frankiaceae bacterium]